MKQTIIAQCPLVNSHNFYRFRDELNDFMENKSGVAVELLFHKTEIMSGYLGDEVPLASAGYKVTWDDET